MPTLQKMLAKKIPQWREDIGALLKAKGDEKISDVSIRQAYGGMRGIKCMVCDTSEVPPDRGLLIRDVPIAELTSENSLCSLL